MGFDALNGSPKEQASTFTRTSSSWKPVMFQATSMSTKSGPWFIQELYAGGTVDHDNRRGDDVGVLEIRYAVLVAGSSGTLQSEERSH